MAKITIYNDHGDKLTRKEFVNECLGIILQNHFSREEILKKRVLTTAQLTRAIKQGKIQAVIHNKKQFFSTDEISRLILS